MIDKIKEQITRDLGTIKEIVDDGYKYAPESISTIMKRVKHNSTLVLDKKTVSPGDWCQVHTGGREPFYAKALSISPDKFVTLAGVYNYENADGSKATPNSFPLDQILPVTEELGAMLEYANKNNKEIGI